MDAACDDEGSGSDGEQESYRRQVKKANLALRECRKTIDRLVGAVACKDQSLEQVKLALEAKNAQIKRLEKSNHKLYQKLAEERRECSQEKERYCSEMMESKQRVVELQAARAPFPVSNSFAHLTPQSCASRTSVSTSLFAEITALKTENEQLRAIVEKSDEENHELCVRFLRMQRSKKQTWKKLQEVDDNFLETLKNLMGKFNDVREEFNAIVSPEMPTQDRFFELSKSYCNLVFECNCLKLELQCLKKDIHNGIYGQRLQRSHQENKPGFSINSSGGGEECSCSPKPCSRCRQQLDEELSDGGQAPRGRGKLSEKLANSNDELLAASTEITETQD